METVQDEAPEGEALLGEDRFRSPLLRAMRAALGLTDAREDIRDDRRTMTDLLADALGGNARGYFVGNALAHLADELEVLALVSVDWQAADPLRNVLRLLGERARVIAEVYRRQIRAAEEYASTLQPHAERAVQP